MSTKLLLILVVSLASSASGQVQAQSWPGYLGPPPQPVVTASPWLVDLVDQSGNALPTYVSRGRTYVAGERGNRYNIRIQNPTGRRVEAVVSVDGLDVIDGRVADFRGK